LFRSEWLIDGWRYAFILFYNLITPSGLLCLCFHLVSFFYGPTTT
jgi:hypothetical protein